MLATFAGTSGNPLTVDLTAANSSLSVIAGVSYTLSLVGDTWTGSDLSGATGAGTATLTVTKDQFSALQIGDSAAGISATFGSGPSSYTDDISLTLDNGGTNNVHFNGATTFAGSSEVTVTAGAITTSAAITTNGGDVSFSAANGISIGNSLASGGGAVSLNADRDGNGSGTLTLAAATLASWSQQAKLTAADAAAGDQFGVSVSISGDTAVVGAYADDGAAGSAYVLTRSGNVWTQQAKLVASDAAASDQFGISVSLSGDTALVGSHWDDDAGSASGSAYVFKRNGTVWTQQAKLTASDAGFIDQYGRSVSISGDTAVVGSFGNDDAGGESGSAYVYTRSGSVWTQQAKLTAADATAADNFGWSVSVNGDQAVVGAPGDGDAGANSGSAYVFSRNGGVWTQQAKLTAADAAAADVFGLTVSIDGDYAIVSAYFNDDAGSNSGSAYIFTRSGSTWTQQVKLTAADAGAGDNFGSSVSLNGDTAVVSASADNVASGSAYVFTRIGSVWTQQGKLTAADAAGSDRFGQWVSVSGETLLSGSYLDDDAGSSSGSAYAFTRSPGSPGGSISSGGGAVSITAADANLLGTISSAAAVTLSSAQNNLPINLGANVAGVFSLTDAELDRISAGVVQIGSAAGGVITVSAAITHSNHLSLATGASVAIDQSLTLSASKTFTVSVPSNIPINLGKEVAGALGLTDIELDRVTAGTVQIGGGVITVSAAITHGNHLSLVSGAHVAIDQGVTLAANKSFAATAASITTTGAVLTTGGDVTLTAGNGIMLNDSLTTGGGKVSLSADSNGDGVGALTLAAATMASWDQQAKVMASDWPSGGNFGYSLSMSGDTAVISDPYLDAVYVFVWSGNSWTQQAKLTAADGIPADGFGSEVFVSGDTVIVGAPGHDHAGIRSGAAYVFTRSGSTWTQQAMLTAADASAEDWFGRSVAVNGNTVIVGASLDAHAGDFSGSAYVFIRSGSVWTQQAKLTASDAAYGDSFGVSVAIAGETAVIGADGDNLARGAAYVFTRTGGTWTQQAKLTVADAVTQYWLGFSVSISGDTTVVGAPRAPSQPSGSAYVFSRSGSTWTLQAKLIAADASDNDRFGMTVSVDGDLAAVGVPGDDSLGGSAYVFKRSGSVWTQQAKLTASDGVAFDQYGRSVSVSGETVFSGAWQDQEAGDYTGSAYVYTYSPSRSVSISSAGGAVSIAAADIDLQGTIATTGAVSLSSEQVGRAINLGTNIAGSVGLTDSELDRVAAGTLIVGDADSGTVTVSADITRPASTTMRLVSGSDIVLSGGQVNTGGGTLLLDSGSSPAAIIATKGGVDVTASALSFSGDHAFVLNGTTVDTQYTQLNIVGQVNLSGVLVLSGTYSPLALQPFMLINNDGADAVVGTFTGLPEGSIISDVLGSGHNAAISYVGGDGNDVVLSIHPVTMWVNSFTPTATGARFTVSKPVQVPNALNLYDYVDTGGLSVLGLADVQLTNSTGIAIAGSLSVDVAGTGFSFVATNGVLPPDTYTLRLRSAADGFQSTVGELLDGDADGFIGGDFVTTFQVLAPAANTVTVSLPNFSRGPDQPVNVPPDLSLGLPVRVSNGNQIASLAFVLRFDPGLLNVTGVTLPAGAPGGSSAVLTPQGAGQVQVTLTFASPLTAGARTVAYLTAAVPTSAAARYGEREMLDLSAVQITNGAAQPIPALDDDAVHANAYFGDLGRNGRYDSFDVQQASRMAVRLDTGFQQHPLLDPTILADFNGNGRIDSFDVQQLSRLALRLPVTGVAALPSPAPTTTDTDRLTEEETPKSEPAKIEPTPRSDVDGNGTVDAQDVAWAIYYFNRSQNGVVPVEAQGRKLDWNGDQLFDAADVLLVVTDLNTQSAAVEGEDVSSTITDGESEEDLDSLTYLLAEDLVASRKKK